MKPIVSISRCNRYDDEEVYASVKASVGLLGGMERFVRPGERILLKPNLLAGKPASSAVTTHPAVVRAVIKLVQEAGATPFVGDSPGFGSAVKVAEKCGVMDVCRDLGVEVVELKEMFRAENPNGRTFKRLEVAKEAIEADGIINIPKLKTHAQMYLTLAVKNLFGCVPGTRKAQWHLSAGVDTLYFASMLLDLCRFLAPRLSIMDGIVGMEGNGPGSGTPVDLGLVLASADAVSMDRVVAEVLGAGADDVPVLKAARLTGEPGAEITGIETVGENVEGAAVRGFEFPPVISVNFMDKLPYFLETRLRKALTARPHIDPRACTLCCVCTRVCPAGVMTRGERIEIDYDRCIRCYCCQEMCPDGAISSKEGWLKRLIPGL